MGKAVAVILGSAFEAVLKEFETERLEVTSAWGDATVHRVLGLERPAYLAFRHGLPHTLLPTQIDWRAVAGAWRKLHVGALLVTSSVGVMDLDVPLFKPCLVEDLFYLDNRLPDGTVCTMFMKPSLKQGHLVIEDGLFSTELSEQLRQGSADLGIDLGPDVVFGYVGGPRTKTPAENEWLAQTVAQVNSMTLAPEVVLANELEISVAGLIVGHKYSVSGAKSPSRVAIAESLVQSRSASERLVAWFLREARCVPFGNTLFRFDVGGR